MTTKLSQDGKVINFTNGSTARTAGQLIKQGSTFGVVLKTTATGIAMALAIEGVFTLPKIAAASTNMAVGAKCYARATGSVYKVLGVATGSVMGTCMATAVTGDTTAVIKLAGYATN